MPVILHWGPRLTGPLEADTAALLAGRARRINGLDESVPTATLLPTGGLGFLRWPGAAGIAAARDFIQSFGGWT